MLTRPAAVGPTNHRIGRNFAIFESNSGHRRALHAQGGGHRFNLKALGLTRNQKSRQAHRRQIRCLARNQQKDIRANYSVFEVLDGELPRVFSVGRYLDLICATADGTLQFQEKRVVYDSVLVPNTIVYPL